MRSTPTPQHLLTKWRHPTTPRLTTSDEPPATRRRADDTASDDTACRRMQSRMTAYRRTRTTCAPGQTEVPVGDEVVIDDDTMRRALEAILMVTDEPLPVLTLARAVGRPTGDVAAALSDAGRGVHRAGAWVRPA